MRLHVLAACCSERAHSPLSKTAGITPIRQREERWQRRTHSVFRFYLPGTLVKCGHFCPLGCKLATAPISCPRGVGGLQMDRSKHALASRASCDRLWLRRLASVPSVATGACTLHGCHNVRAGCISAGPSKARVMKNVLTETVWPPPALRAIVYNDLRIHSLTHTQAGYPTGSLQWLHESLALTA